jgi:hypothetical protein
MNQEEQTMMSSEYKAKVILMLIIWLALGCNFSDIPDDKRQKATITSINGDEYQTDHGRYVSYAEFQVGDAIWIVEDTEGYNCLCTDDENHTCYDVILPGSDAYHRNKREQVPLPLKP